MTKKSKIVIGSLIAGAGVLLAAPLVVYGAYYATKNNNIRREIKNYSKNAELKRFQDAESDFNRKNKVISDIRKEINDLNRELDKNKDDENIKKRIEEKGKELETATNSANAAQLEMDKADDNLLTALQTFVKYSDGSEQMKVISADYILAIKRAAERRKETDLNGVDEYYPTKSDSDKIVAYYDKYINQLNEIKYDDLTVVTLAWREGVKYDWEITKSNYAAGGRYLLNSFDYGPASSYPANSFYESIGGINEENSLKALRNLKEAAEKNIILSKVVIKNNVKSILESLYSEDLEKFLNGTKDEMTVEDFIKNSSQTPGLKQFHQWYATEYYSKSDHGQGENLEVLKITKTNKSNELENSIIVNDKPVYGLGFTQKDLDAKNVGLVGITGNEESNGKKLYDAILKMSTTSDDSADAVFQSGYKTTKTATENMTKIAGLVADLIAGEGKAWTAKFKYDANGINNSKIEEVTLEIRDSSGKVTLENFNKWLNQEQFFFGREDKTYYTDDVKKKLETELASDVKQLKDLGYGTLLNNNKEKEYGSITREQFFYGALEAFKGYRQFINQTKEHGLSFFGKKVTDYNPYTYEYTRRAEAGVGAYDGGKASFFFNVDPYYSLPKWSVTSFANHEGIMGHHNQIYYAKQFLAKQDGRSLGDIFHYTSYAEGWALFMEWFGIESGWYGTPNYTSDDYYSIPTDFTVSKGITSFFTAKSPQDVTPEMIAKIKDLHGGVYWKLIDEKNEIQDEKVKAQKAIKLTNMLQYFGALNEAQLRNMRRAVDTAYHGTGISGYNDLQGGASISDVRRFLRANSALGIGDIYSESRRYLNLPGQATSYNAGKEKMLAIYDRVRKHFKLSREEFVQNKKNIEVDGENVLNAEHGFIKELLDYMLINGGLPLDALEKVVEKAYNLKS
ncbi:hypothetical protein DA803_00005 [[Mycoplasma] phocae]|uniref:DUF885 domain-containing protein n=1 Tax=[Mycoplasma] phocae TaxID=142651 RepID=A0A2Z5IQN6_9BACT|nr:DUF885 family protein [[Mycoplasma] phocae]AXE60486.1 hypothetical protein DA803_00005 [[Mycoplasma] phocae]